MARSWEVCGLVMLVLLLLIPALTVTMVVEEAASEALDQKVITRVECSPDPRMDATHEVRFGQDVVWQIPSHPRAILFMGHGGNKHPLSFFDPGPKCEQCYGLPEDRAVVLEILRYGFAVIAVKSLGATFHARLEENLQISTSVLKMWSMEHSLESLPLLAWGHSSGGYFVTALSSKLRIRAAVLMCCEGLIDLEEAAIVDQYPPTFFAYMPLDKENPYLNISSKVKIAMDILRERGVEVAEKQCWPKPLTSLFFTERIPCLSNETSSKIYGAYKAEGWLDSNGYLTTSPTANDWESVLWKANALPFCEEAGRLCLAMHIQQELSMAYAEHSLTSDANDEILPWLESHIFPSIESTTKFLSAGKFYPA